MRKIALMTKRAAKLSPFWAERLYPSAFVQANPLRHIVGLPSELKPLGHSPDEIRRWIAAVCRRLSITPTELARHANLAPSTVNRFLSGKGNNENVSASTLLKLTQSAEQLFEKFVNESSDKDFSSRVEVEADWSGKNYTTFDRTIITVPVVGFVSSEFWNLQKELPKEDRYQIAIPIQNYYADLPIIGLEVRGGSSNKKYTNGSILVCVPYYALDREPLHGEFVIANRIQEKDRVEIIIKQYIEEMFSHDQTPFRQWLVSLEGENRFLPPIEVSSADDSTLIVSFLIIASFQAEARLFKRPKSADPRNR